jgi:phosphoglycolate phosphatase-like HAD superfamily hydrolase
LAAFPGWVFYQKPTDTMNYLATFDIDNTLVRSSAGHMQSLISALKDIYGLSTDIDVINHHGMTDQEIIIRILERYDIDHKNIRSNLKECMNHMELEYAQIVQSENIVILEGVRNLLTRLDQMGFFLGLVTGNLETIARAKLNKIKIGNFFKFGGFGSDHISRTELVRIAFSRAENQFGLAGSNQLFHFGDAPQDMRAAREAGATPIGVATGVFAADELQSAGAYKVVPNLKDFDAIIQILSGA